MAENKSFGYLGYTFQLKLLNQLLTDKKFIQSIMEVIDSNYFENQYFKLIAQMIKEYYEKYHVAPTYDVLDQNTKLEIKSDTARQVVFDMISEIKECDLDDHLWVQEKALKFCKQEELKKAIGKVSKILEKGDFESYDKCEGFIRDAIQVGEIDDSSMNVFQNIDEALVDDFRDPIPIGIMGIDNILDGGLAKGEIGLFLAPTGVGKTTVLTKVANSAFNNGYNVLQIFFEDNPKVIQRKHITCWTGVPAQEQSSRKDEVLEKLKPFKQRTNKLVLEKLASDRITISHIKNRIRKLVAEGNKFDVIVLDYIDCVLPDKHFNEVWAGEGLVMRQFETMCTELDVAGWTAAQGNRSSISSEVVTTDQMGGSIKKAQVGHVIITIAKTLQQKEMNLATIAITKSRVGKDGIVFENCKFDNATLDISTEQSNTLLGLEEEKEKRTAERIKQAYERSKRQFQK